jgi:glycosyltransferase involved in cell wall biosynthesis
VNRETCSTAGAAPLPDAPLRRCLDKSTAARDRDPGGESLYARTTLAIVTDAVAPWHGGGKETRTWHYSQQLAACGFEVHIYTMRWWPAGRSIDQGPVHLHALCRLWPLYRGRRRSIPQALAFSIACVRLITARFDVVEVDQIPILPLLVVKVVCLVRGKPVIATWHELWGPDYWRAYLGRLGALAALLERLALLLPDRLIAVSDGTAERIRDLTRRRSPVHIGRNGVDLDEIAEAPVHENPTDLLFVGRLLDHKNVGTLIDAVAELSRRGRSLSLTIVGDGPEGAALRQRARRQGLWPQVTFTGELPSHSDVIGRIKSAQVMVFPTRREGFGLVAVEAMACGTPVITTNHPDNLARLLIVHGRNGYLCEPDGSDLPELILRALAERPVVSAAAVRAADRYTWHEAVRGCLDAYRWQGRDSGDAPSGMRTRLRGGFTTRGRFGVSASGRPPRARWSA